MKGNDAEISKRIGANIRALRKERGIRQSQLAGFFGVDQTAVSKWENGSHSMTVEHFFRLCDYFDVSADFLAGRDVDIARDDSERSILAACRDNPSIKFSIVNLLGIKNAEEAAG